MKPLLINKWLLGEEVNVDQERRSYPAGLSHSICKRAHQRRASRCGLVFLYALSCSGCSHFDGHFVKRIGKGLLFGLGPALVPPIKLHKDAAGVATCVVYSYRRGPFWFTLSHTGGVNLRHHHKSVGRFTPDWDHHFPTGFYVVSTCRKMTPAKLTPS